MAGGSADYNIYIELWLRNQSFHSNNAGGPRIILFWRISVESSQAHRRDSLTMH